MTIFTLKTCTIGIISRQIGLETLVEGIEVSESVVCIKLLREDKDLDAETFRIAWLILVKRPKPFLLLWPPFLYFSK